jgi:uncharacterized membrane protein YoaK (UPF0700 family)
MKIKKIIGVIFQIPLTLLVFGSFAAAIYAAYYNISGITYQTSVIIGAIIILYFIGKYLTKDKAEKKE